MAGKPTAKQFRVTFTGERTVYAVDGESAAETVFEALRRVGFDCEVEADYVGEPINQAEGD